MSLSKMPPEVLSCVLNNRAIQLRRRLHLRLLSARCCAIIEDALKKMSSLVIREKGKDYIYRFHQADDLIIKPDSLTTELIRTLSRLFSGITELTLAFGWYHISVTSPWSSVSSLLSNLSTNLTTLKLYGDIEEQEVQPLADALATLPNLTSLTLDGAYFTDRLSPLGPVLSRLEKFACSSWSNWSSTISSFLSPRCTHLLLNHAVSTLSGPLLAQLSASLTHLNLLYCCNISGYYSFAEGTSLSMMHRLTSLTLNFGASEFDSSLFSCLAHLTRLTEVKLYGLDHSTQLALPSKQETPLPGIKRLTLEMQFHPDRDPFYCHLFCQTLSLWFPSLVHFTFITQEEYIAPIRSRLGKLPFTVEFRISSIPKYSSDPTWYPGW